MRDRGRTRGVCEVRLRRSGFPSTVDAWPTGGPNKYRASVSASTYLASAVLVLCCGLVPLASSRPPSEIVVSTGNLVDCAITDAGIDLGVETGPGVLRVTLGAAEMVDGLSGDYRRLAGARYTINGPCPAQDDRIVVTHCPGCASRPLFAIETGGASDGGQRLFVVRSLIDRLDPGAGDRERTALFVTSMMLARHNRADGRQRTFWLRDKLERALDAYSSERRARDMYSRFGGGHLSQSTLPLVAIAARYGDSPGLVRALPFIPPDARASPFVGSWGAFALEVYLEGPAKTLEKLY